MSIIDAIQSFMLNESLKLSGFYSFGTCIYDNLGRTVLVPESKGVACRIPEHLPAYSFYVIPYSDPELFEKISNHLKNYYEKQKIGIF